MLHLVIVMLSVIMLSAIILGVMAPIPHGYDRSLSAIPCTEGPIIWLRKWCHDTEHNGTQYYDTQHNNDYMEQSAN